MSLIYSALNNLEQEHGAQGAPEKTAARPFVTAAKKTGVPPWVYLAVLGCVLVVLAGVLSMTVLREQSAALQSRVSDKPASPAPTTAPGLIAAATPAELPVPAKTDVPVMAAQPGAPPTQAGERANESLREFHDNEPDSRIEIIVEAPKAEVMAKPAKTAQPKPHAPARTGARAILPAAPAHAPAAPAAAEINQEETNSLTLAIKHAIQAGNNDEAEALLKQLGTRLPPESITLLQLHAWHKMQGGDQAQAISLYRQIVGRIPDDETATVNLALLYWKAGRQGEARHLIGALAERHPESETVQRYSRQFGALR